MNFNPPPFLLRLQRAHALQQLRRTRLRRPDGDQAQIRRRSGAASQRLRRARLPRLERSHPLPQRLPVERGNPQLWDGLRRAAGAAASRQAAPAALRRVWERPEPADAPGRRAGRRPPPGQAPFSTRCVACEAPRAEAAPRLRGLGAPTPRVWRGRRPPPRTRPRGAGGALGCVGAACAPGGGRRADGAGSSHMADATSNQPLLGQRQVELTAVVVHAVRSGDANA